MASDHEDDEEHCTIKVGGVKTQGSSKFFFVVWPRESLCPPLENTNECSDSARELRCR